MKNVTVHCSGFVKVETTNDLNITKWSDITGQSLSESDRQTDQLTGGETGISDTFKCQKIFCQENQVFDATSNKCVNKLQNFNCFCEYGAKADSLNCPAEDVHLCLFCYSDYIMVDGICLNDCGLGKHFQPVLDEKTGEFNYICEANVCVCDNGVLHDMSESVCWVHDAENCESCDFGYYLENRNCSLDMCKCKKNWAESEYIEPAP